MKIFNLLGEKQFKVIKYHKLEPTIVESDYNKLLLDDLKKWLIIQNNIDVLLPPFSYNILCKNKFSDIENEISIEFRIQTKEDFITTESYYYTIHKNDSIPLNIKIPLLCMLFRILRRKTNIAFFNNIEYKEKMTLELYKIMKENQKFIEENSEIVDYVLNENQKLIKCWKNDPTIYGFHLK